MSRSRLRHKCDCAKPSATRARALAFNDRRRCRRSGVRLPIPALHVTLAVSTLQCLPCGVYPVTSTTPSPNPGQYWAQILFCCDGLFVQRREWRRRSVNHHSQPLRAAAFCFASHPESACLFLSGVPTEASLFDLQHGVALHFPSQRPCLPQRHHQGLVCCRHAVGESGAEGKGEDVCDFAEALEEVTLLSEMHPLGGTIFFDEFKDSGALWLCGQCSMSTVRSSFVGSVST